MIKSIKNWLKDRFSKESPVAAPDLGKSGVHPAQRQPRPTQPVRKAVPRRAPEFVEADEALADRIESNGPGKNVLIRNKFVREDTGTHETLKILDDSLVDSGEETGIDPYNTGGFDRSRNWDKRFGK
jgi:hypothetical protein